MLNYAQINKEVQDPVSGDYYPPSLNDQIAFEKQQEEKTRTSKGFRDLINNLESIMK